MSPLPSHAHFPRPQRARNFRYLAVVAADQVARDRRRLFEGASREVAHDD
ncbi:hypothetical protein [Frigoribacterium sp. CG_9.8]|nr:hypothetical protein [Frigoribacterium sp. CG_9.8]MBG6107246.1 hypothetical protein [Frigoribacterium sp. CG_9.8]